MPLTRPTIISISDRWDPRLSDFRRALVEEFSLPPDTIHRPLTRSAVDRMFGHLPNDAREEVWKFCDSKWRTVAFDRIECALIGDRIVSISGCRRYGQDLLRVGMHLYTLRAYRQRVRNLQFHPGGYFERQLEFARGQNVRCLFLSIYAHSRKLESHVKNLAERRISPDGGPMVYIHDLERVEEPIFLHNVPQHIFLYKIDPDFSFDREALHQ